MHPVIWLNHQPQSSGLIISGGDGAGHILATAHGRFDLAFAFRATRHLHRGAVVSCDGIIDKGFIAIGTIEGDAHVADIAAVIGHWLFPVLAGALKAGHACSCPSITQLKEFVI